MEERVEQQGNRIVELKQRRAALNEKKTTAASGMAQCRADLKKVSSELRMTEEASEKLEENRRRCQEKKGDLDKSKKGVDLNDLRDTITRKKDEMKRLRVQEDKLRDEKAVLDEHQEVLSILNSKKKDAEERQARIDKIQSKCRREIDKVESLKSVSEAKWKVIGHSKALF